MAEHRPSANFQTDVVHTSSGIRHARRSSSSPWKNAALSAAFVLSVAGCAEGQASSGSQNLEIQPDTSTSTSTSTAPAPKPDLQLLVGLTSTKLCEVVPPAVVMQAAAPNAVDTSQATCEPDAGSLWVFNQGADVSARYTPPEDASSNYAYIDMFVVPDHSNPNDPTQSYFEAFAGDLDRTIQFGGQVIKCSFDSTDNIQRCLAGDQVVVAHPYMNTDETGPAQIATELSQVVGSTLPGLFPPDIQAAAN